MKWIEIETQISHYRVRTYRGQSDEKAINKLLSGDDSGFLKIDNCYWYNDEDDSEDEGKVNGDFDRLGKKQYANFTGTLNVKCSTIINVAYLKGGYENEPIIRAI